MVSGMPMLRMPPGIRLIQSPYVVLDAIRTPSPSCLPLRNEARFAPSGAPSPPIGGDGGTRPPPGTTGRGRWRRPCRPGPRRPRRARRRRASGCRASARRACSERRRGAARSGPPPGAGVPPPGDDGGVGVGFAPSGRVPLALAAEAGSARRAAGRRPPPRHRARRLRSPRPRPCRARTAARRPRRRPTTAPRARSGGSGRAERRSDDREHQGDDLAVPAARRHDRPTRPPGPRRRPAYRRGTRSASPSSWANACLPCSVQLIAAPHRRHAHQNRQQTGPQIREDLRDQATDPHDQRSTRPRSAGPARRTGSRPGCSTPTRPSSSRSRPSARRWSTCPPRSRTCSPPPARSTLVAIAHARNRYTYSRSRPSCVVTSLKPAAITPTTAARIMNGSTCMRIQSDTKNDVPPPGVHDSRAGVTVPSVAVDDVCRNVSAMLAHDDPRKQPNRYTYRNLPSRCGSWSGSLRVPHHAHRPVRSG